MRIGKNTLNNMMLSNLRKNQVYQAIITDLAITGSIERDTAEKLLGYEIPGFLKTPDGKHLEEKENKQQSVKKDDEDIAEDNNDDDNEDNSDENNDDEEDDRDVAEDDDEE